MLWRNLKPTRRLVTFLVVTLFCVGGIALARSISLGRLESLLNYIPFGRYAPVDRWIYLDGPDTRSTDELREGQALILTYDLERCLWVEYGAACTNEGALKVEQGWCYKLAKSSDGGRSWVVEQKLPDWMDVSMPQRLLIGERVAYSINTSSFQILRNLKDGRGWIGINPHFGDLTSGVPSVRFLAVNPHDPLEFYVVVRPTERSAVPPGLYVSTNGGVDFRLLGRDSDPQWIGDFLYKNYNALAIDPYNPDTILLQEGHEILRSNDRGLLWTSNVATRGLFSPIRPILALPNADWQVPALITQIVFDPQRREHVFAASNKGLLFSSDGGKNWSIVNIGVGSFNTYMTIAVGLDGVDSILVGSIYGLFGSSDGGRSWSRQRLP